MPDDERCEQCHELRSECRCAPVVIPGQEALFVVPEDDEPTERRPEWA